MMLLPFFGVKKLKNMKFIGYDLPSIMHIMMWMACGANAFIYFFFTLTNTNDKPYFQSYSAFELIICMITLIVRVFIISLRYGYTHVDKIKLRYNDFSSPVERREYIVNGWRNVDAATLDLEIKYSIVRLQIESEFLNYNTMSHLDNFATEKLAIDSPVDNKNNKDKDKKEEEGNIFVPKKIKENKEKNKSNKNNKEKTPNKNKENINIEMQQIKIIQFNNNNNNNEEIDNLNNNNNKNKKEENNETREIEQDKYSKLIPFLKQLQHEKQNKFNHKKYWEEQITKYQINHFDENEQNENNPNSNNESSTQKA